MIFISDGDLERIKEANRHAFNMNTGSADRIVNLLSTVLTNISQLQREKPHPEPMIVIESVDPVTGKDTYKGGKG